TILSSATRSATCRPARRCSSSRGRAPRRNLAGDPEPAPTRGAASGHPLVLGRLARRGPRRARCCPPWRLSARGMVRATPPELGLPARPLDGALALLGRNGDDFSLLYKLDQVLHEGP